MIVPYRLIIAPKAAADLVAIHDDIAKDSPQNATRVATRIMDGLELLQDVPYRTILPNQPPGFKYPVRSVAIRPYIVFFLAIDSDKVVRICAFGTVPGDPLGGLTEPIVAEFVIYP